MFELTDVFLIGAVAGAGSFVQFCDNGRIVWHCLRSE